MDKAMHSIEESISQAAALQGQNHPLEAFAIYESLLPECEEAESRAKLCLFASSCLAQAGELTRAREYTERADKLNPQAEDTRALLLFSYATLDFGTYHFSNSVEKLRTLLNKYDDLIRQEEFDWFRNECLQRLGFALFEVGDIAGARSVLEQVSAPEDSADIRLYLARIDVKEKHLDKAEERLREVLRDNPDNARALFDLGSLYLQENRISEAKCELLRCRDIEADWALPKQAVLQALATVYSQEGNEVEARRYKTMAAFHSEAQKVPR